MGFLSNAELKLVGFKKLGENVKVSNKATIYGAENISIGNNSRIDDFCILSAGKNQIIVEDYVHIAPFCSLIGEDLIWLKSFSGLSSRVAIYSSSDDYTGHFMTNPTVPKMYTNVENGKVILNKHVIIGVGSAILPNVTIGIGTAVAAFSLVSRDLDEFIIAAGVPAKRIKERSDNLLQIEEQFYLNI